MQIYHAFIVLAASLLVLMLVPAQRTDGSTTSIFITGTDAPGTASAEFDTFAAGPLTNDGKFVFSANLTLGPDGVTTSDEEGVWWFDGTSTSLLAREGSAGVPDVLGANFDSFSDLAIDSTGDVILRASLETGGGVTLNNNQGLWRYSGGTGMLLARTGSGNVSGVAGADFASLPSSIQASSNGQVAHNGALVTGSGVVGSEVTSADNMGLWSDSSGVGTLIARKGVSSVPDVSGATFSIFGQPKTNSSNQTLFIGSLTVGGDITTSNRLGIWQYSGTSETLLARTGVGNVPDVGGASFETIDEFSQNNSGQVATLATIDVVNDRGVWLYTAGAGALLGRKGVGGVPGIIAANFENFEGLLINDAGQVLVRAELEVGAGGVSASDNRGLWFLDGSGSLLLRTGSGGVPEVPAASFVDFSDYSLNENGQLAVAATLEIGFGGVDASNDSGLWFIDPGGVSRLVAREGDSLAGHTIASVGFLAGSAGNEGQLSGLNDLGHLLFQATFDDGDSGLFLFNPLDADFDFSGQVNAADHLVWKAGFGIDGGASQMQGDSDDDQDVDGLDFLAYQREFGFGGPLLFVLNSVPEPASWLLFSTGIVGCLLGSCRRKRRC